MRRTTLITAFFCFSIFWATGTAFGQVTFLVNYDTVNFIQPNNAGFGDTVTYTLEVVNNSNTNFFGQVSFFRRVGNGPADLIFTEPSPDSIGSFASKPFVLVDTVTLARFGGGINVVVVWPTAPNVTTLDSAYGHLTVIEMDALDAFADAYPISIFPNPTAASVHFHTAFSPILVRETSLIDQQGRILRVETGLPRQMDLNELSAGIYFLRVQLRDGSIRRFKVVKRN